MLIEHKIDYYKGIIYKTIIDELQKVTDSPVKDAMEYMIVNGGKRLRPLLCLGALDLFHEDAKNYCNIASTLEMIHTYSLIHDDLPALDDDSKRRGIASCHIKFDESTAILAGDALLNLCFEVISGSTNINDMQKVKIIRIISDASGSNGMILGQIMDLGFKFEDFSLQKLYAMHNLKTGAVFAAALEVGGILANADTEKLSILREIGLTFGLLFQITDDLEDSNKQDYEPNILNYVSADEARQIITEKYQKIEQLLSKISKKDSIISCIMQNTISVTFL